MGARLRACLRPPLGAPVNVNEDAVHEKHRPHEGQRFALELVVPAQRRRHGRGFTPERVIPLGVMATPVSNNAVGSPDALVYATPLGDYKPMVRRRKRRDGTRAAVPMREELPPGARLAARADLESEEAARADVMRALADGQPLELRPLTRVVLTGTGAVRTIPYKGAILKWASIEDLVLAISQGAI